MMGPLYWEWIRQYQATDQLLALMFLFGALMMFGYYAAGWIGFSEKITKYIKNILAAWIIGLILMTLAAPSLVGMGLILME